MTVEDLRYVGLHDGLARLQDEPSERVLVLGEPQDAEVEVLEALAAEVRAADANEWQHALHVGVYTILRKGRWEALVAFEAKPETRAVSGSYRAQVRPGDEHLVHARHAFSDEWEDALPFLGTSPFHVGDVVRDRVTDEIGRVKRVVRTSAGHRVEVDVGGELHQYSVESLTRIDGDPRDPAFWLSQPPASADDVALTLTWTKLRTPLTDVLYSFAASKTIFRPYQFIPALKVLNSSTGRLLIADEVGLGKTIEAGIVWTELEQRGTLTRTLVVAPSSLTQKWQAEMSRRFDRKLERIKPNRLQEFADALRAGQEPELHAVISLESLRSAVPVLESLNELAPRFDLIIVDEAHALRNPATRSSALGQLLSDWADYLLFLSATPINLRSADLYNLVRLLDEGMFRDQEVFEAQLEPNRVLNDVARLVTTGKSGTEAAERLAAITRVPFGETITQRPDFSRLAEILDVPTPLGHSGIAEVKRLVAELSTLSGVLSRTRKVDVHDAKAVREPHNVRVDWTKAERDLYDAVQAHLIDRAISSGAPLGFTTQMPLRMAASCLPALQQRLTGRALGGISPDDIDEEVDETEGAEGGNGGLLGLPVLWRPLTHDTKFQGLQRALMDLRDRGVRQAMIFSTFRDTLAYLARRLEADFALRVMHGGVRMDDRPAILEGFRRGDFDLLLVSEVGSEGLDFEFCNVLVNYDLPWNPMKVEQRIGRLDRFGQQHEKIFILNMQVPGTIETDILQRLYERIGIFTDSIGDLEPILHEELDNFSKRVLDPALTPDQRLKRADEIAVAIEKKKNDVSRLQEERANLAVIDELQVEGLSESGPTDGRYIGAAEIRRLLDRLFQETRTSLSTAGAPEGTFHLRGTAELAGRLNFLRGQQRGTKYPIPVLQARLRDGEPISVTFDAEVASRHDVELLSVRHPLVQVALRALEDDNLKLRRYGLVAVTDGDVPTGSTTLVRLDIVETTGLRPTRELWATGIDAAAGTPAPDVGPAILRALAAGELRDVTPAPNVDPTRQVDQLADLVWERRAVVEDARRRDNEALAQARLEARLRSQDLKIARAEETLRNVRASERDRRIIGLHEGRLRNLRHDRQAIGAEIAQQRQFSMRLRPIAFLVVVGTADVT